MDWHGSHSPDPGAIADTSRILAVSSGNAQTTYNEDEKFSVPASLGSTALSRTGAHRYPVPPVTLRSNDHRARNQQRLRINRLKRRSELAWRCWRHPAYLKYVSRPRRDVDKKGGEIIWEDDVERAFSNAIVNIPAMGKSKKSQHGKACGRNELIQEWIKQETGKTRGRKQVSSHLQVFDGMFKSVPEWRALNKIPKNPTEDQCMKDDEYEYYSNSIADMVQVWKVLNKQSVNPDIDSEPNQSGYLSGDILLSRLYFEMWISQPEKIDQVLHRYTQVQSDPPPASAEHLESIADWRDSWPDLVPIIETDSPREKFDIILLETTCRLKDDFPPPKSKLGISLELAFSSSSPDGSFFATYSSWSCTSHFYQKGKLETKAVHDQCHSLGPGKVEPPFESKWWAEKFIQLTKTHRRALDSGDDVAIAAADESNRLYLQNLRVMQQISFGPETVQSPQDLWYERSSEQRRMAILLWSFSQASEGSAGLTTWKRLIPPPRRIEINSPSLAAVDLTLAPYALDSAMDTTTNSDLFGTHQDSLSSAFADNTNPSSAADKCYADHHIAPQLPGQDEHPDQACHRPTYVENVPLDLQHILDFQHDGQWPQEDVLQDACHPVFQPHPILSSNYFEAQEDWINNQHLPEESYYDNQQAHHIVTAQTNDHFDHRQPLLNFDMNTHALLQEQLDGSHQEAGSDALEFQESSTLYQHDHDDQVPIIKPPDEPLETSLMNNSVFASNAQTQPHSECSLTLDPKHAGFSAHSEAPEILSPIAQRPILQHHHSFAGLTRYDSEPHAGLSNASRTELALLLEGFETSCKEAEDQSLLMPHIVHGLQMTRPHSQPPPLTSNVTDPAYAEVDQLHVDGRPLSQRDWVEVKLEG